MSQLEVNGAHDPAKMIVIAKQTPSQTPSRKKRVFWKIAGAWLIGGINFVYAVESGAVLGVL